MAILLALLGLVGGVGITALGPGGVLPTIGLFALTTLSPAEVAGTAIVTHVATGALATAAFTRSGQLREPQTRRTALVLGVAALVGTPIGVLVNGAVSQRGFGIVLGILLVVVAALVWFRETRTVPEHPPPHSDRAHPNVLPLAVLGVAVAAASGLIGVGGPMLMVPLLIALRVPVLESLAAAQVQSVVIAGVGSVGYLASGAIDWPLAALIGVPELAGVLLGWKIAHALPTHVLKRILVVVLLVLAPYLALHGG